VLGSVDTFAMNQSLYKKLPYHAATDFVPVGLVIEQPILLIARNDLPANTMPEFIAYAKVNQAKMQYASAGVGSGSRQNRRPLSTIRCGRPMERSKRRGMFPPQSARMCHPQPSFTFCPTARSRPKPRPSNTPWHRIGSCWSIRRRCVWSTSFRSNETRKQGGRPRSGAQP
jgi:hypothetical protein